MNAITKLRDNLGVGLKAFWGSGDWISQSHSRGYSRYGSSPNTNIDYEGLVGDLWRNTAVQACLNQLMMAFPESRLCVWDVSGEKPVKADKHPLNAILDTPNSAYDDTTLYSGMVLSTWADGNNYWGLRRSSLGYLGEIAYIPHYSIEPKRRENSRSIGADYFLMEQNGNRKEFSVEKIAHTRFGFNPYNDLKGLAPLASAPTEVFSDSESANYSASGLKNKGAAWAIISPKSHESAEIADTEGLSRQIEARTTGDNRHRVMTIDTPLDIIFPPTNKDMQPDALRRTPEARICALFGLPPMWVGLTAGLEHATLSNYEQSERVAWRTITAVQRMIARQLTQQLLRREGNFLSKWHDPRYVVGWDYSEVRALQADKTVEWERVGKAVERKIITVNEARQEIEYEELTPEQEAELAPTPEPVAEVEPRQLPKKPAKSEEL